MSKNSSSDSSSNSSSQFQMMDISVCVLVLEGLMMESNLSKEYLKLPDKTQSISSSILVGKVPVTAVISCFKSVSGNKEIATHIPSLPLVTPIKSISKKAHKYIVRWPVDYNTMGDALSTFRYKRLMKKESLSNDQGNNPYSYGYMAEEIELNICLMRGSDMITLGSANLVVTGEEIEEITVDLPINVSKGAAKRDKKARSPSPLRRNGSKIFNITKGGTKTIKAQSFPGDSRRKYKLSEHSMVRLRVKVTPTEGSSYDEIDSLTSENYYQNSSYNSNFNYDSSHVVKDKNKIQHPPRQYIPHQQLTQRSRSNPRPYSYANREENILREYKLNRGSSVSIAQRDYPDDYPALNITTPRMELCNARNLPLKYNVPYPVKEKIKNDYGSQISGIQEYPERMNVDHEEQKVISIPRQKMRYPKPSHPKSYHHKRHHQSSSKTQQKSPQTLFDTIVTHGVNFISGTSSLDYVDKGNNDMKRTSSRKKYSTKKDYYSSSESDSDHSSYSSTREHRRGRSPHRRR